MLTIMQRVMRCLLLFLFYFLLHEDARSLRGNTEIREKFYPYEFELMIVDEGTCRFLSQVTHLCTLTCCAAHPRPDNNRCDDHRASRARAVAKRPSTR